MVMKGRISLHMNYASVNKTKKNQRPDEKLKPGGGVEQEAKTELLGWGEGAAWTPRAAAAPKSTHLHLRHRLDLPGKGNLEPSLKPITSPQAMRSSKS